MPDIDFESPAARLPHLRRAHLEKGDPVALPLVMSSVYHLAGKPAGVREYGRFDNPTWEAAQDALGHLEAARCVAFPSGMAAIAAVFFALLKAGDRVLLPLDGYYAPRVLAARFLEKLGIRADLRPTASYCEGGFSGYALVLVETPANPGLDVCDIAAVSAQARRQGALVVCDNTTMTPFGQRPLDLGAHLTVASDTKAANGHGDVLFGHVAGRRDELIEAVLEWRGLSGAIPGPFEAWLVHRGLETLELRFGRMCDTAEAIAPRLKAHPAIRAIRYPGLPDDPSHALARTQMRRFGSLIGLTLEDERAAQAFVDGCALVQPATSFGAVHSSAERRAPRGDAVAPGFVRLSVGCEPTQDLWRALQAALDAAASG